MIQTVHAQCQQKLQQELAKLQGVIIQLLQQEQRAAERSLAEKLQSYAIFDWPDLLNNNCPWCIAQQLERLNAVLAALSQLELNLYGICSDCECVIEPEALQLDPAAQRCNKCKTHANRASEQSKQQ